LGRADPLRQFGLTNSSGLPEIADLVSDGFDPPLVFHLPQDVVIDFDLTATHVFEQPTPTVH